MTKISLYTVTERQSAGLWNGTVPSHEQVTSQSHDSRGGRFQQILDFVADNPSCTRGHIARGIKMAKSPHLNGMIEELVSLGLLHRLESTMPNGMKVFYYRTSGD